MSRTGPERGKEIMGLAVPSTDQAGIGAQAGSSRSESKTNASNIREVRFEHSLDLPGLLSSLEASILISTYQAGKLAILGSHQERLTLSFHNFDRPMGVAVDFSLGQIAVAARDKVWQLHNVRKIAPRIEPEQQFDSCFLTRSACVTGEIQSHEMAWVGDELWIVNTLFSCLSTLHPQYSFVPRWQPPFVSALAPEDRCHLNGLAVVDNRPKYVTAMSETDVAGGWRDRKAESGCLIDVESGETIAQGFAMPHSPRWHAGYVWVLDSGRGRLVRVDPKHGNVETVANLPGYTRGLAIYGSLAFIGLSKIRETSTFDGVPIAENRDQLRCGVGVIDLHSGKLVAQFEFRSGVDEIFDVTIVPGTRQIAMRGPFASEDGANTIWTVPEANEIVA